MVFRIEDTDKERSTKDYERDILDGLHALGLKEDSLYRQSERNDVYNEHIKRLIESDAAYISEEPSKQDPDTLVSVVRLRNPGKTITFKDEIRGDISFDTTELGDFVIARSITEPLYHLAVVIDDQTMGVTHVIRGEDHISNTPRQILIQEAFGFSRPTYAHMPLILGSDRSKLSKRHGAVSVNEYLKNYTTPALINYLALLGWNPGTEQEIFSLEELIEAFDISKIQKGGAIFSTEKLDSINAHYLKEMPYDKYRSLVTKQFPERILKSKQYNEDRERGIVNALKERGENMAQIQDILESGQFDFYVERPTLDKEQLTWKDDSDDVTHAHLSALESALEVLDSTNFTADEIKQTIWDYATEKGRGSVLWPLRYALTGMDKSPDPFSVASVLGKEETLARIENALALLS